MYLLFIIYYIVYFFYVVYYIVYIWYILYYKLWILYYTYIYIDIQYQFYFDTSSSIHIKHMWVDMSHWHSAQHCPDHEPNQGCRELAKHLQKTMGIMAWVNWKMGRPLIFGLSPCRPYRVSSNYSMLRTSPD